MLGDGLLICPSARWFLHHGLRHSEFWHLSDSCFREMAESKPEFLYVVTNGGRFYAARADLRQVA